MICKRCKIIKTKKDFYKHSGMKSGFLSICKVCKKEDALDYREKNIEKVKSYDRDRPNKEERKIKCKKNSYKYKLKKAEYFKRWSHENKIKRNCHNKVKRALKNGLLVKKSCEICGDENTQGHHPDYSKPLEVKWLCSKHHGEEHRRMRGHL